MTAIAMARPNRFGVQHRRDRLDRRVCPGRLGGRGPLGRRARARAPPAGSAPARPAAALRRSARAPVGRLLGRAHSPLQYPGCQPASPDRPARRTRTASAPARLTARSRRSVAERTRSGATTRSWSPRSSRSVGATSTGSPSRTTSAITAPRGQPQLAEVDAVHPRLRRDGDLQDVRAACPPAALPRAGSRRPDRCRSRRAPGHPGQRRALHQGVDHHHHDDRVDQDTAPSRPSISGIIASTIGTAPRRPGPGQERLLPPGHPERGRRRDHRQRPGDQQHDQTDDEARDQRRRPAASGST